MTAVEKRDIGAELETLAQELKLSVAWEFVPFSKSRNAGNKHPSLNWKYALTRDGRSLLAGDYMQGSGQAPASKLSIKDMGGRNSIMRESAIRHECETGTVYRQPFGFDKARKVPAPRLADLLSCLVMDAGAADYATFENWANEYGYDPDSRKGEAIYRECLRIGLTLRNMLGDDAFKRLQALAAEY